MKPLSWIWRQMTTRRVRQAWGLADSGGRWSLVGLSWQAPGLARVRTTLNFACETHDHLDEFLVTQLREARTKRGRSRQGLSMALAADQLVSGVLAFPARMPKEDWVSEIQLEASQVLGQDPEEVHFDFQPEAHSDGLVQRVYWVGCMRSQIMDFKNRARLAGWHLDSVEPAVHAAQRAAAALHGGLPTLLTQPTQDWQFHWPIEQDGYAQRTVDPLSYGVDVALQQAMKSEVGGRLVACGLALKAWA